MVLRPKCKKSQTISSFLIPPLIFVNITSDVRNNDLDLIYDVLQNSQHPDKKMHSHRKAVQRKHFAFYILGTLKTNCKITKHQNSQGYVYSFTFDLASGKLSAIHEMLIGKLSMITSIQSRSWMSREARDPSLLINVSKNVLCLYKWVRTCTVNERFHSMYHSLNLFYVVHKFP